jgi:PAS domain S-box-containing protein
MEKDILKTDTLLELIFLAESKDSDDEVINIILPAYLHKLNCFMTAIIRKNNSQLIDKQIIPSIFGNESAWTYLRNYIINTPKDKKNGFCELIYEENFYYIYCLSEYGFLVLGRKNPFEQVFKTEFRQVVNFLGKTISQSEENKGRKETEKKLAEERQLLRIIIDNIPINIYAKDLQYRKTLANISELKHLGNSSEFEVIGKSDLDLYGEEIANNTMIEDKQVVVEGKALLNEEKHIGKDQWALISKLPLKNEVGDITGMVGISIDYTERRKIQEQLSVFLNLFDNISDAVQVNTEDGQLFYINKVASERLGIDPNQVAKYKVTDYLVIFPTLEAWKKHVEELKTKDFLSSEGINLNQKTGQEFPVEVTVKYVNINEKGFIVAISRDITERKKTEAALQTNEKKYRQLTENMLDIVWTADMQFKLTFLSPSAEKVFGEPIDIQLKRPIEEKFTPPSLKLMMTQFSQEMAKESDPNSDKNRTLKLEVEHYRADKSTFWAEINMSILRDELGNPIGIQGITQDITERKKAEHELRISEERKASLIASMSDIVYVLDNNLILNEYHNPEGCESLLDPEPFLGKQFDNIPLQEPAKSIIKNALLSCVKTRSFSKVDYYLDNNKGERFWFELHATVLNNQQGEQSGVTCIIRDRTHRRQQEDIIRQQVKLQEILIKISSVYINVNLKEVESTIQNSLQELGKFVGADRAYIFDYDFTDNSASNTYEWCEENIAPEIANLQRIPLKKLPYFLAKHTKGEEFYIGDVSALSDVEGENIKAILEPQGIKSIISIPMINADKLMGFVGFDSIKERHTYSDKEKNLLVVFSQMLVNVGERKRSESVLIQQEEKYRNIISNMNLGIIEVDKEENIQFANQSFSNISGYTIDELLTMKATIFLESADDKKLLDEKLHNRELGIYDSYELAVKNKQGEERWWFVSGAPNYNDNNELIGSIGIHLDITEQKKLEQQLEQAIIVAEKASKAKEVFLANMSHEIRTPLNVITGMVRELGKEALTERQISYVAHSETAAHHLLTIINNILDMSKIEAGEFELDNKNFSISSVASDVRSILYSRAIDKNIELRIMESSEIKRSLIGDAGRLRQILINLVGNALKFTDKGYVELKISVKNSNNYFQCLLFEVNDSGIGMSEEYIQKLFDKFSQEDGASNRRFEGTGLGMSITKELIQLMGGNIQAKSRKGIGTQVSFELNLPIGDETKLVDKNTILSAENCFRGIKVLLVEDNEMNRFIATQSLHFVGCEVIEAENGLEAIKKLKTEQFDLIFMDIQMPEMDGVEAAIQIRNTLGIKTAIVALTANAFKHDIDLYLSVGMNDYLIKPYREQDLFQKIEMYTKNKFINSEIMTIQDTEILYDLSQLKELSRGDETFVNTMLAIFKKLAETTIDQLKESLKNDDIGTINKLAHKIKPSIDSMGIVSLKDKIRQLENYNLEENSKNNLEILTAKVINVLQQVVADIQ